MSRAAARVVADIAGAGPAVLLLHGQPGTAADWRAVVTHLAGRYTTVAVDRPGYGRTGGPAVDFDGNADAALALLDRVGVERAVVAAHSWAGGVALRLAASAPDRIAGLVLVAPISPGQPVTAVDRLLATRPLSELAALAATAATAVLTVPPVWRRVEERLPAGAGTALAALLRRGAPSAAWRSFAVEQRVYVDGVADLAADLPVVTCPTAIVVGQADHVVPAAEAAALARRLAGATLHRIAGAGHLLPLREPAAVAGAVDEVAGRAGLLPP